MKNLPQKVRSRKLNSRVDLTAMVSVSFLLIIFFMVVGELSKPKAMNIDFPDKDCDDCLPTYVEENLSLTILLDKNNRIISYSGIIPVPSNTSKNIEYGKNGIRKELLKRNKIALEYSAKQGKPGRGIVVMIKPSRNSNYGNLIEILDELKIAKINTYNIDPEFTSEESKLLASN
ncbi:biopolymer transporter ExbD [Flavobacterium sp. HBTb2-11-1]|uniref:ExbD/TolR family protein n=1 Tax=Flavobacterium sp. HBTb2-11-1 TaxID=2692212 RepID=UPI00136D5E39|nr:biopolymer transporter ExbD [Flavobacterium sp. HBTb2-11-1]MXO07429.1 biopolymer transporter ExbD [Flavobacterium sp. HBTb2-11-1]